MYKGKRGATFEVPNTVTSRVSCDHVKGSAKALEKHTHDALAGVDVHINGCAGCILDVIDKEEKDKEWVKYACLRYYEHRLGGSRESLKERPNSS